MNVLLRSASVLALSAVALAASAQSILSNLGGVYTPITNTTIFAGTIKAVGLTTGASPLSLVSMSVLMANQNFAAPETFTAGVYSNLNSAPGVQLAGLSSATVNSTTPSVFALTPPAPYVLAPNTTYWFVVSSASNSLNLNWNGLTPSTAPTPTGVSYVGYRISNDSGATWASSAILNGVNIQAQAQAVPEPSALAALGLGAVALLRRKRA